MILILSNTPTWFFANWKEGIWCRKNYNWIDWSSERIWKHYFFSLLQLISRQSFHFTPYKIGIFMWSNLRCNQERRKALNYCLWGAFYHGTISSRWKLTDVKLLTGEPQYRIRDRQKQDKTIRSGFWGMHHFSLKTKRYSIFFLHDQENADIIILKVKCIQWPRRFVLS